VVALKKGEKWQLAALVYSLGSQMKRDMALLFFGVALSASWVSTHYFPGRT
jgi:hypothetical protein